MKPLFVSSLYHPNQVGGAEKVVRIIAEGLLAQGHEPVVVTADPGRDRVARIDGVKVHYVGLRNVYWPWARQERGALPRAAWHAIDRNNPLMARAVARILDAEKPDVVNTHNLTGFSAAVWPQAKSRGVPLVHTLHDYSLMCPKTSMFRDDRGCTARCATCVRYTSPARRLSGLVDGVVGVSRFTLERHLGAGYFPGAGARVIHNGLPAVSGAAGTSAARPGARLRLGYVGQLTPAKGIRGLVAQLGQPALAGTCELVVAGTGAPAFEALLRAEAPPNVRFLGFVDPAGVYRSIDVLVVPSLWDEPFATTVLEAYTHGVPVVASARGGLPEMIESGRTGLLYEPTDPQGIARALDALLRNPALLRDMRPGALGKAREFGVARMRTEYLQLLTAAAAAAPAARGTLERTTA